jgi:hypothetical protein
MGRRGRGGGSEEHGKDVVLLRRDASVFVRQLLDLHEEHLEGSPKLSSSQHYDLDAETSTGQPLQLTHVGRLHPPRASSQHPSRPASIGPPRRQSALSAPPLPISHITTRWNSCTHPSSPLGTLGNSIFGRLSSNGGGILPESASSRARECGGHAASQPCTLAGGGLAESMSGRRKDGRGREKQRDEERTGPLPRRVERLLAELVLLHENCQ